MGPGAPMELRGSPGEWGWARHSGHAVWSPVNLDSLYLAETDVPGGPGCIFFLLLLQPAVSVLGFFSIIDFYIEIEKKIR